VTGESDKVFSSKSDLVFEGTPEETLNWLLRTITDGCYVRNGKTGELQTVNEYVSLYV
jgi:hypothetical protein